MKCIGTWIHRWRRHWESAYGKRRDGRRGSRYEGVRDHHRTMLRWMLLHPWRASR